MSKKILKRAFKALDGLAGRFGYELSVHRKHTGEYFAYGSVDSFSPDNEIMQLYDEVLDYVGGKKTDNIYKKMRFQVLMQLVQTAVRDHPDLDVAECGCWNGHSTRMSAIVMERLGFKGSFHVFDSFEGGLSEFTDRDRGENRLSKEEEERTRIQFQSSYDLVKSRLEAFDFVKLYKGWIPDRFDEVADKTFGFVNIDVDMYDPIMDSLNFFYPRLVDGGVIFLDDYNCAGFPGAESAVSDFLDKNAVAFFLYLPSGGAFIIK